MMIYLQINTYHHRSIRVCRLLIYLLDRFDIGILILDETLSIVLDRFTHLSNQVNFLQRRLISVLKSVSSVVHPNDDDFRKQQPHQRTMKRQPTIDDAEKTLNVLLNAVDPGYLWNYLSEYYYSNHHQISTKYYCMVFVSFYNWLILLLSVVLDCALLSEYSRFEYTFRYSNNTFTSISIVIITICASNCNKWLYNRTFDWLIVFISTIADAYQHKQTMHCCIVEWSCEWRYYLFYCR